MVLEIHRYIRLTKRLTAGIFEDSRGDVAQYKCRQLHFHAAHHAYACCRQAEVGMAESR